MYTITYIRCYVKQPHPRPILWNIKRLFVIAYLRQGLGLLDFLFFDEFFFFCLYFFQEVLCVAVFCPLVGKFSLYGQVADFGPHGLGVDVEILSHPDPPPPVPG